MLPISPDVSRNTFARISVFLAPCLTASSTELSPFYQLFVTVAEETGNNGEVRKVTHTERCNTEDNSTKKHKIGAII
jgi:hypothetical protein